MAERKPLWPETGDLVIATIVVAGIDKQGGQGAFKREK
jgi:hypothetical protein